MIYPDGVIMEKDSMILLLILKIMLGVHFMKDSQVNKVKDKLNNNFLLLQLQLMELFRVKSYSLLHKLRVNLEFIK